MNTNYAIAYAKQSFMEITMPVRIDLNLDSINAVMDADEMMKKVKIRFTETQEQGGDNVIGYIKNCAFNMRKKQCDIMERAVEELTGGQPKNWAISRIYEEMCGTQLYFYEELIRKMTAISGILYNDNPFKMHDESLFYKKDDEEKIVITKVIEKRTNSTLNDISLHIEDIQSIEPIDKDLVLVPDSDIAGIRKIINEVWREDPAKTVTKYL